MPLPNFFLIGAGRSGTTSLYEYLRQHPEVYMSPVKEPSFFAFAGGEIPSDLPTASWHRENSTTTLSDYGALFEAAGNAKAIGEASTIYLRRPEVAPRIHQRVPDARLIAILRHPVERAYAGYLGLKRDGHISAATFEEQLRDEERLAREGKLFAGQIEAGLYHQSLTPYYELFGPEQIRVCLSEDLDRDPVALSQQLFGFLGVQPTFVPDTSQRHGGTGIIGSRLLRGAWTRSERVRRAIRPLITERLRDRAFDRITRDLERPPLAPETRARLLDLYRDDIIGLQDLIKRDLSHWLE